MYFSTKTYGNERGLSCCFRQPAAVHSHCSLLHGYALGFEFVFNSSTLDQNNWCFDFGGMKPIKLWLDSMFDHTTLIARSDPALEHFEELDRRKLIKLRKVDAVGCEKFAELAFTKAAWFLGEMKNGAYVRYPISNDVDIHSVKVFEHGSNSATFSN